MTFKITGLPSDTFRDLFDLTDDELAARGMKRCIADEKPGYPCRVSLRDAEIGEPLILGHFEHHSVDGPYRSSGPILVREATTRQYKAINSIPESLAVRKLSVRAFDQAGLIHESDVIDGEKLYELIEHYFEDPKNHYIQVHNAGHGCFACQVDRV